MLLIQHVLSTRFPLKKNYTRFSYDGATCQHVICHLQVFANSVIVRGFLDKINNNNNIKTITELSWSELQRMPLL